MTELPSADSGLIDRNKLIGALTWSVMTTMRQWLRSRLRGRIITRWIAARTVSVLAVTHVASTAAGYGVTANGTTYRGDYKNLTEGAAEGACLLARYCS